MQSPITLYYYYFKILLFGKRINLLEGVDADVVHLHGVAVLGYIPSGKPLILLFPKLAHSIRIVRSPRLLMRVVVAIIRESAPTHVHIQHKVELIIGLPKIIVN